MNILEHKTSCVGRGRSQRMYRCQFEGYSKSKQDTTWETEAYVLDVADDVLIPYALKHGIQLDIWEPRIPFSRYNHIRKFGAGFENLRTAFLGQDNLKDGLRISRSFIDSRPESKMHLDISQIISHARHPSWSSCSTITTSHPFEWRLVRKVLVMKTPAFWRLTDAWSLCPHHTYWIGKTHARLSLMMHHVLTNQGKKHLC